MTGRFAPTPSGRMHVGNMVAMLAAWLSAHERGESMVLRIEDVDGPRAVRDADAWIMDDLAWLGLEWQGEPMYQSQRGERYAEALACVRECTGMLDADMPLLYPCWCSRADIRAASAPQEGDGAVVYPGTCRCRALRLGSRVWERAEVEPRCAWRLAVPEPDDSRAVMRFTDVVFGSIAVDMPAAVGDVVLRRSDGIVAYHLAVVVDDLDMGVTDIVRGRDLLNAFAVQQWLRECLRAGGWRIAPVVGDAAGERSDGEIPDRLCDALAPTVWRPRAAHIPLIDDRDGRRLAKRNRDVDMGQLRERGVSPERVLGACAWLLGLMDEGQLPQAMSLDEVIARFSWDRVRARRDDRVLDDAVCRLLEM